MTWRDRALEAVLGPEALRPFPWMPCASMSSEEALIYDAYLAAIEDAAKIAEKDCDTCGSDISGLCPCHGNAAAEIRALVEEEEAGR